VDKLRAVGADIHAGALRRGQHGGDLGLHVRGEAGIWHSLHVGLLQRAAAAQQNGGMWCPWAPP